MENDVKFLEDLINKLHLDVDVINSHVLLSVVIVVPPQELLTPVVWRSEKLFVSYLGSPFTPHEKQNKQVAMIIINIRIILIPF